MQKKKQMLRYVIPFIALVLISGLTLSCGGPSTKEVSKVEEEEATEKEAEAVENVEETVNV